MALTIGIIGLPQSGKTTLFNALTKAGAPVSGYATSTVQANIAVVQVPDPRLQPLAEIFKPKKVTYATVEFVDVAGLGQGAHTATERREGLSAEFLGHIRNADALAIVLRTFENSNVPHIYGDIDPNRDLDSLNAELALTDLATVERRIERTTKAAKSGDKKYQQELEVLQLLQDALNELKPVNQLELLEEDAAEYLESLGLPKLGAERVIQVGYRLLNLITFLTAGEDEVRAWTVTKGAKAPEAAGKIHSDIERGFIRGEVTRYEDFMECGSFAAAMKKGLVRLEGKDYVIRDGDIAHFRFNIGK